MCNFFANHLIKLRQGESQKHPVVPSNFTFLIEVQTIDISTGLLDAHSRQNICFFFFGDLAIVYGFAMIPGW